MGLEGGSGECGPEECAVIPKDHRSEGWRYGISLFSEGVWGGGRRTSYHGEKVDSTVVERFRCWPIFYNPKTAHLDGLFRNDEVLTSEGREGDGGYPLAEAKLPKPLLVFMITLYQPRKPIDRRGPVSPDLPEGPRLQKSGAHWYSA